MMTDVGRAMHRQFVEAAIDPRHLLLEPPDDPDQVTDSAVSALGQGLLRYAGRREG